MSETTEAQAPAGESLEVTEDDVKPSKGNGDSSKPKTDSTEKSSQPKSGPKDSDGDSGAKQEAKDGGPAPWAKDLADRGIADPNVDAYLREVWQPRMTQYEQQMSQWDQLFGGDMERAQIMAGLAEALENDPAGTYQQMGELLGLLDDGEYGDYEEGEFPDEGDEYAEDDGEQPDEYRQWVMEKMQQEHEAQQDAEYEGLLTDLETEHPGFDRELFHAAIVAFDGDPEMALNWYMKYHRAPEPGDEMDGPTPVGEGNPTPPEQEQYSGLGDAIDAFLSQDKTSRGGR